MGAGHLCMAERIAGRGSRIEHPPLSAQNFPPGADCPHPGIGLRRRMARLPGPSPRREPAGLCGRYPRLLRQVAPLTFPPPCSHALAGALLWGRLPALPGANPRRSPLPVAADCPLEGPEHSTGTRIGHRCAFRAHGVLWESFGRHLRAAGAKCFPAKRAIHALRMRFPFALQRPEALPNSRQRAIRNAIPRATRSE